MAGLNIFQKKQEQLFQTREISKALPDQFDNRFKHEGFAGIAQFIMVSDSLQRFELDDQELLYCTPYETAGIG